jgi:addiction module HigA family antidote
MNDFYKSLPKRRPTHPGEMLREDFMPEFGLTVASLAQQLDVSRQTVNELVHERRALSVDMSIRLSMLFDTTPVFWLNLQRKVDLWEAAHRERDEFAKIVPLRPQGPAGNVAFA